jgi:hypothetical protein
LEEEEAEDRRSLAVAVALRRRIIPASIAPA